MKPRHAVPATKFVILHNPSEANAGIKLAADIFANPGSIVLAPLGGKVLASACPDTASHPGCQISGHLYLPDGQIMPFVAAHLIRGTYPAQGASFKKGQIIGKIDRWEQHPASTHTHIAFRAPGDRILPPPATIGVLRGFELCGPPPGRSSRASEVAEISGEPLHE